MKIKQMLCATAAIALLGAGCSDEEAAGKGDLSLSIQISSAVNAITTVHVMGTKGDAKAEALAQIAVDDSLLLAEVLADLPAGTYTLTIDGYVGDATAPLATTSAEVTIEADEVATAALVLGPKPELLAAITASNTAPKTGETVTFSATVSGPGAESAALIWSDDCDGDFLTNGSASVQWSSRLPDGCTVTLAARAADAATTATLALGVTTARGTITRVVGHGACYQSDDGYYSTYNGQLVDGSETAKTVVFSKLNGLAIDNSGNLVIPDQFSGRVWRWNPSSDALTRLTGHVDPYVNAGNSSGNGGPATQGTMYFPMNVAVAPSSGDIYISDIWKNDIRKITDDTGTDIITRAAGTGGGGSPSTGALATSTPFYGALGLAVDADGNLFVGSTEYYSGFIAQVFATAQTVFTYPDPEDVAGNNFNYDAWDIDLYNGHVYAVARFYHAVTRLNLATREGIYIAGAYNYDNGDWQSGFTGDGSAALGAQLYNPRGLYINQANGDILVADSGNHRIRKITQAGTISTVLETQGTPGDLVLDSAKNMYYTDRDSCSVYRVQGPY